MSCCVSMCGVMYCHVWLTYLLFWQPDAVLNVKLKKQRIRHKVQLHWNKTPRLGAWGKAHQKNMLPLKCHLSFCWLLWKYKTKIHLKMTLNLLDIKYRDSNAQKGNTTQKHQDSVPFSVRALCLCMSIVFVWETLLPSEQIRVDGADGFNVTPTPPPPRLWEWLQWGDREEKTNI